MSFLQAGGVLGAKLIESPVSDVAMVLIFHSLLPKSYQQFYGILGNYEVGGPILRFVDSPIYILKFDVNRPVA